MGWNDFDDEDSEQLPKPQPFEEQDYDGKSILSQPYQGSPEQKALIQKTLQQRFKDAASDDDVQGAQRNANLGNMVASAFQGLGDYFTAPAVARGRPGMRDITAGVRQTGADNVAAAKSARAARVENVLEGDKLGQLEKDRARQTTDQAFQDKERSQKEKGWQAEDANRDPKTPQARALQKSYTDKFGPMPGIENASPDDIKNFWMEPLKLKEQIEQRREEAAQRAEANQIQREQVAATQGLARQDRLDKQRETAQNLAENRKDKYAKKAGLADIGEEAEGQYESALAKGKNNGSYNPTDSSQFIDNSSWAPNFAKSDASIEAKAAAGSWIDSYLRDESGAAIPDAERGAYEKIYFPQPGDTKQAMENKALLRQQKMQSARYAAGGTSTGAPPKASKGPQAGDVEDGYRFKGGDPADPKNWEKN